MRDERRLIGIVGHEQPTGKLRKVTSKATCRSPSSMQAERVLPVTQFKPTRLRLSR
jgi:hypothetical protein